MRIDVLGGGKKQRVIYLSFYIMLRCHDNHQYKPYTYLMFVKVYY